MSFSLQGPEESAARYDVPTRESLLEGIKNTDDHASWRRFYEQYYRLLFDFARRTGLSEMDAQDVVQDTMVALVEQIKTFTYSKERGSFKNWLCGFVRQRMVDKWRKTQYLHQGQRVNRSEPWSEAADKPDESGETLEAIWQEEWERHAVDAALEWLKVRVPPLHVQVFQLVVMKNLAASDVGQRLGVNIAKIYWIVMQLKRKLAVFKKELERHGEVPESMPTPGAVESETPITRKISRAKRR